MKNKIITVIFSLNCISGFCQSNHVWNASFENGPSGQPTIQGQVVGTSSAFQTEGPNDWVGQEESDVDNQGNVIGYVHSPDWYGPSYTNYETWNSGAEEGQKYIGMGGQEMIQQNILPLEPHAFYMLSMYIQIADHVGGGYLPSQNNGFLQVYLSDHRLEYEAADYDNPCNYSNNSIKGNSFITLNTFEISKTQYPVGSGWHKITYMFRTEEYKTWLAIQVGRNNFSDDIGGPCGGGMYVLIDDIKIQDICSLPCIAPEAFLPIEYSSWADGTHPSTIATAGVTGANDYTLVFQDGSEIQMSPWHVYVTNAMLVEFTVLSNSQQILLHDYSYSPMTLNNQNNGNFQLFWEGDNHAHNFLPNDSYPYLLTLANCYETKNFIGYDITIIPASTDLTTPFEERMYRDLSVPSGCCRTSSWIVGQTISESSEDHSQDFTIIGTNAFGGATLIDHGQAYLPRPVNVTATATVDWTSETEITLLDGVNIANGADVNVKIEACGIRDDYRFSNTKSETKLLYIDSETEEILFPNPTTGKFIIKLKNSVFGLESSIQILDQTGRTIWHSLNLFKEASVEIDLTNQNSAMYFAKIINEGKITTLKIIKE